MDTLESPPVFPRLILALHAGPLLSLAPGISTPCFVEHSESRTAAALKRKGKDEGVTEGDMDAVVSAHNCEFLDLSCSSVLKTAPARPCPDAILPECNVVRHVDELQMNVHSARTSEPLLMCAYCLQQ